MAPLFLFGTLQHPPLLEAVIGRSDHLTVVPAKLPDFLISAVAEGPFPMITRDQGGLANGVIVTGLTTQDMACLDFYESAFEYHLAEVTLSDGSSAQAYFPKAGLWTAQGMWSLEQWTQEWGSMSVLAAQESMEYCGTKTAAEVGAMFPMIRARAWSQLNARHSRHGSGTLPGSVQVSKRERPYAKYFAVDEYHLRHDRFDGGQSAEVLRAVFRAPDAALVLPYDPHRDCVLVVEQVRMGPLARGDGHLWQLEPIAGRLDPGEDPETAVRREAIEEAGLTLGPLEQVAEAYCSPGNSSEFHYIFVGIADLPDETARTGGLDAEDEDIRAHILSFEQLMEMCATLQIANSPLVLTAYWLAYHRARLRTAAGVVV